MKKILVPFALVMLVTGCAGSGKKQVQEVVFDASDPAVQLLNESALRIARASEQAALAQSVTNSRTGVTEEYKIDLTKLPRELRDPILLEGGFNGELEIFLRSLTDSIGWQKPVILGQAPSVPLIVSFTEQRRPPAHWLADAGYQSGALADVVINTNLKQVVLRYKLGGGLR